MTESTDMSLNLASPADLPALIPLMQEFYAGEKLPWGKTRVWKALEELWAEPQHGRVWLARSPKGEPIGYGILCFGFSLEYGGRDAFVDELYVVPGWRDRGVGTVLLNRMQETCGEAGITALHLEVDHANEAGRRLYHRHGFVDHDRFLMTKRLREAAP